MEDTVEELVEIEDKKEPATAEGPVKDINFGVNTMRSGKVTFVTKPINGILEGIFVNSTEVIQIRVTIGTSNVRVFEIQNHQGDKFIPVRMGVVDSFGESFRDTAAKWALNDSLMFEIKGPLSTDVGVTVRYI